MEKVFVYLKKQTDMAYANLKETAAKGKSYKYIIGYTNEYTFMDVVRDSYYSKTYMRPSPKLDNILECFIEKMKDQYDIPLVYVPSIYNTSMIDRAHFFKDAYERSYYGDIKFDWSE